MSFKKMKKSIIVISLISSISFIIGVIEMFFNKGIEGLIFTTIGFISIVVGYIIVVKDEKNK